MARLYTTGFEMQTKNSNFEFTQASPGAGIINNSTATKRSGSASIQLNGIASTTFISQRVFPYLSATKLFARIYVNIATLPSGTNCDVLGVWDNTNSAKRANIRLTSGGVLQLYDNAGTQIGSDSTTLSTGTWYMVELEIEGTNAGTEDLKARLEGSQFAGTTTATVNTYDRVYFGSRVGTDTFDIYFDDMAINDDSGATQNTYPGQGNVVLALPTGAGDSAATTGIFSYINEIPPTSTATSGSTMIELDNNPTNAEYAMTDSSTLGIGSSDTVTLISVIALVREETAGTSNYILRIKSASGGTTSVSASADAGGTSVLLNPSGGVAFQNALVSHTDPTTGVAWTPTGTNSVDNMQCGIGTTDGAPDTWCVWLGAYIEFVPTSTAVVRQFALMGVG